MWVDITPQDVAESINDAELSAALETFLAPGQQSPLLGIIADKTAEVRGYVRVRNRLAATGVPEELKSSCIDLVIFDALGRLSPDLAKRRLHWHEEALKRLDKVSEGKFSISQPDSEVTQAPSPKFSVPVRDFGTDNERGI